MLVLVLVRVLVLVLLSLFESERRERRERRGRRGRVRICLRQTDIGTEREDEIGGERGTTNQGDR